MFACMNRAADEGKKRYLLDSAKLINWIWRCWIDSVTLENCINQLWSNNNWLHEIYLDQLECAWETWNDGYASTNPISGEVSCVEIWILQTVIHVYKFSNGTQEHFIRNSLGNDYWCSIRWGKHWENLYTSIVSTSIKERICMSQDNERKFEAAVPLNYILIESVK